MRPALFSLALFALSALSGCISYEEEIWIENDGTGRLHATLIFSEKMTQLMRESDNGMPTPDDMQLRVEKTEGVELDTVYLYEADDKIRLAIKMRFKNFAALKNLQSQGQQNNANLFGQVRINPTDEGHLLFQRAVQFGQGGQNESDDLFAQQLMRAMLAGDTWKYTVHFPAQIVSSNATEWHRSTHTLSWSFDLLELSENPGAMRATLSSSQWDPLLLELFGEN